MKTKRISFIALCMVMVAAFTMFFVANANVVKADDSVFAFENGAYVKLSGDGGLRFRLQMDSATATEIRENADFALYFYVASATRMSEITTGEQAKALFTAGNAWEVAVNKDKIYAGEDAEGAPDGFYYANVLIDANNIGANETAKIAYRTTDFVAAATVYDGDVYNGFVKSSERSIKDVASAASLRGGYYDDIAAVYDWLGTTGDYAIVAADADDYAALSALLEEDDGLYFYLDGVADSDGLLGRYENGGIKEYVVTWQNDDGTTLKTESVAYGVVPSYDGSTPLKASSSHYDYTFKGWDKNVVAVTENVTYTATYNSTVNFDLVWENVDNTMIDCDPEAVEKVTRVTTTGSSIIHGSSVQIPSSKLTGIATVSFDVKINSYKDVYGEDLSVPSFVFWQSGELYEVAGRLTPKAGGVNEGYQRVVDLSTGEEVAFNAAWTTDRWYRITLVLKDNTKGIKQAVNNGTACSYEILYKNFSFNEVFSTVWTGGTNTTIGYAPYDENVVSVNTSNAASTLVIPSSALTGKTTVSFDIKITSLKDGSGNATTTPNLIYWQSGNYWDLSGRLTPKAGGVNEGYQTITDLATGNKVAFNDSWTIGRWYRIELTLKDNTQELKQIALNGNAGSYDMLYKNFRFVNLVWNSGTNTSVSMFVDGNDSVTRVTTTESHTTGGGYISIPAASLSGMATVSFDINIKSMKDRNSNNITAPKIIYYQATPGTGTNYGSYWDASVRLTPKDVGVNEGYQTITKISDGSVLRWDADFELDTWYRVTLTLKNDTVQLLQAFNNGSGGSFDILYKNFVFTPAA